MPRAELQTARLTLRPVLPRDGPAVVAGLSDLAVSGWLAVVPYPYHAGDFDQFQTEYAKPGHTWTILEGETFAGIIGLEDDTLGYWLAPPAPYWPTGWPKGPPRWPRAFSLATHGRKTCCGSLALSKPDAGRSIAVPLAPTAPMPICPCHPKLSSPP